MKKGWGKDLPSGRPLASGWMPDASLDHIREFGELQRVSTSPENAVRFLDEFGNIDVRDELPKISVPAIILHARDDLVVPFEQGRELARLIPNSRFVPLEGRNHMMLEEDLAWKKFLREVRNFLGVKMVPSEPPPRLKDTGLKGWLRGPKPK